MDSRAPSVDRVARQLAGTGLPHPLLVDVARRAIAAVGSMPPAAGRGVAEAVMAEAEREAAALGRALLQPVINATGVLLHTNLGRAPLAVERPAGYANLELDLGSGRRGDRNAPVAALLARACGTESALVVNNGAAAILLVLTALARGRDVVVSRGELVEIGGGFRVPEVLEQSGARLVEVGTTNRTRPGDYQSAVGAETALILKVHTSNYAITGFTESVPVSGLAAMGLPVVVDLGSGLLDSRAPWLGGPVPGWLADEPAVAQTVSSGADIVTFSGDKLLGGPQAGIVAGRADLVERCRRHPLARALRPGGLILDALQEVILAYLRRDAGGSVALWRLASTPLADLRARAQALGVGEVVDCESVMGGGTLPGVTIPSAGIAIDGDVTSELRGSTPPVIAYARDGRTWCDLRTVLEEQDPDLGKAIASSRSRRT